jgi:hypothetical protein
MVLSMGAVILTVGVILIISWRPQKEVLPSVDYQAAVANAKLAQTWPILIPETLPKGYNATSARFEPESYGSTGDVRWYLGFQTANNEFVSLWQSDGPTKKVVAAASNNAKCDALTEISGTTWSKCETADPLTRAIYKTDGDVTTIVSGTASWNELTSFASSLTLAKP